MKNYDLEQVLHTYFKKDCGILVFDRATIQKKKVNQIKTIYAVGLSTCAAVIMATSLLVFTNMPQSPSVIKTFPSSSSANSATTNPLPQQSKESTVQQKSTLPSKSKGSELSMNITTEPTHPVQNNLYPISGVSLPVAIIWDNEIYSGISQVDSANFTMPDVEIINNEKYTVFRLEDAIGIKTIQGSYRYEKKVSARFDLNGKTYEILDPRWIDNIEEVGSPYTTVDGMDVYKASKANYVIVDIRILIGITIGDPMLYPAKIIDRK